MIIFNYQSFYPILFLDTNLNDIINIQFIFIFLIYILLVFFR